MAIEYSKICRTDESLRGYQQEAKSAIFSAWDKVDNVMFQMPTGTGKTRLFTSLINDINRWSVENKTPIKILIIAHRKELIDQIDESLQRYHVAHGIIAGGRAKERNLKLPVQVASIQTVTHPSNKQVMRELKVDYVIIDEAHHSMARTYQLLWHHLWYKDAKKLGVTATPWRMNHSGFTKLYDQLIRSKTIQWFMDHQYLAPYEYYSIKDKSSTRRAILSINEFDIEGDYKVSAMERVMDTGRIRAKLLNSYQQLAAGKKGIIYSISRAHSEHICKEYSEAGIRIANIDSQTPKGERDEVVNKFRKGELDVIVNVDIFSEGFDCPDIEFIQLARPTQSLVKYLQQVGRGLRPTKSNSACIIIDNVGIYNTFGLPNANRQWLHHFKGNPDAVIDESPTAKNKGLGTPRELHIDEGNEDMVLIQQITPDEETNVHDVLAQKIKEQPLKEYVAKPKKPRAKFTSNNYLRLKSILIYNESEPDNKYTTISIYAESELGKLLSRGHLSILAVDSNFVHIFPLGAKDVIRFNRSGVDMQKHKDIDEIALLSRQYNNRLLQSREEALHQSDPRGNLAAQIVKIEKYRDKTYDSKAGDKPKGKRVSFRKLRVNDSVISPRYGAGRVVRFSGYDLDVHFQDGTHTTYRYPSCFVATPGKVPFLRMNIYEKAEEEKLPENHHKRWDEAEENRLRNLFEEGRSTAEIAEILQRSEIGILMRLDKLGLITYQFEG